jgi:hypothetical protein
MAKQLELSEKGRTLITFYFFCFKAMLVDKSNEVIECRIHISNRKNGKEVGDLDIT